MKSALAYNCVILILLLAIQVVLLPRLSIMGMVPDVYLLWLLLATLVLPPRDSLLLAVVAAIMMTPFSAAPFWFIIAHIVYAWLVICFLHRYVFRTMNTLLIIGYTTLITFLIHLPRWFGFESIHLAALVTQLALNIPFGLLIWAAYVKHHVQPKLSYIR